MLHKFYKNIIDFLVISKFFFKNFYQKTFLIILLMLFSGILEALNIAAIYPIINFGLGMNTENTFINYINGFIRYAGVSSMFIGWCYALMIITIITALVKYLNYYFSYNLLRIVNKNLQRLIIKKFTNSEYKFFINHQQGHLIHTSTIAAQQATALILHNIRLINDFIVSIILIVIMFSLTPIGSIGVLLIGIAYGLIVRKSMNNIIRPYGNKATKSLRDATVVLNELITGIKVIKIFNTIKNWSNKFLIKINDYVYSQYKLLIGRAVPEILMRSILFLTISFVGIFIFNKTNGDIVPLIPVFATFSLVILRLFPELSKIANDIMTIIECMPGTRIVYQLLNEESILSKVKSDKEFIFNSEIEFKNVEFKYEKSEKMILKNINFNIKKTEIISIVGASGGGKSTILSLLLKLFKPTKGQILVDGVDLNLINSESFLKDIGYVSQENFIFNSTIKDNIKFGMENCSQEMIQEAAKLANAHEFILNTRFGYETIVGDMGVKLSGGQKQRIAIARAILRKPKLLIFDEATSSLDNVAELEVKKAIDNISKKRTVIIVAHRLSTVEDSDQIFVCSDGTIVEKGTHKELIANDSFYAKLYYT